MRATSWCASRSSQSREAQASLKDALAVSTNSRAWAAAAEKAGSTDGLLWPDGRDHHRDNARLQYAGFLVGGHEPERTMRQVGRPRHGPKRPVLFDELLHRRLIFLPIVLADDHDAP